MAKMRPQRRGRRKGGAPWEPSPEQLQVYDDYMRGDKTQAQIGAEIGQHHSQVSKLIARIDRWMIPRIMDNIRALRVNHYGRLMVIYSEAMREFYRSKADRESETTQDADGEAQPKKTKKRESRVGEAALLNTAIKALFDARQMFGANEAEKLAAESLARIAGVPRFEAIEMRIRELTVSFNDAKTMIAEVEADVEPQAPATDPEDDYEIIDDDPEV